MAHTSWRRKGFAVGTVVGLSLDSNDVAWVLLDAADGTVLDHDVMELHGDPEIAGAAARSAHSIARACGFEVDRVRITWTDDVTREGVRLRTRLGNPDFTDVAVEVVPLTCARAVVVDPAATGVTARLALAYGAALAVVGRREPTALPDVSQPNRRLPRRGIASAVLGVAAAAVLGLLCLSAGAAPQPEPPMVATAAVGSAPSDTGWTTVSIPSDHAATMERKVVAAPSYIEPPVTAPVPTHAPVRVVAAIAAEPTAAPAEVPHLTEALPLAGPVSGLADPASLPAPEPDMTEVMNAISALP
ncbi:hypothetical protein NGTWS1803_14090 [Mycolicibacterium cyprinidarum]|nr:hypothetical protein NGTWS1803_14090 [Mycolicibacterium sp. NGTWS1803]